MKKIALFVSSLTGNTQKIADALADDLKKQNYVVQMQDCCEIGAQPITADYYILCFWCRRAGLDDDSKRFLARYQNISLLAVGTCGHYPDSDYGTRIKTNVAASINQSNHCLDVFLSQGAVSAQSTEFRRRLPIDHPHYLDDSSYARHLESQKHPDSADINNAIAFVNNFLTLRL